MGREREQQGRAAIVWKRVGASNADGPSGPDAEDST